MMREVLLKRHQNQFCDDHNGKDDHPVTMGIGHVLQTCLQKDYMETNLLNYDKWQEFKSCLEILPASEKECW